MCRGVCFSCFFLFVLFFGFVVQVLGHPLYPSDAVMLFGSPIRVYVVDLDGVGGFRAANHSEVIRGVFNISLGYDGSYDLNSKTYVFINVSYQMVKDWQTYRYIVENENNCIIVNTHDEILPVPNGYSKEEWIDKIADFILNRWGTWVHTGGLAFHIIQYQNGTRQEWMEGLKQLMKKANIDITLKHPTAHNPLIHMSTSALDEFNVIESDRRAHILRDFAQAEVEKFDVDYCIYVGEESQSTGLTPFDVLMLDVYATFSLEYILSAAFKLSNSPDQYGVFVYSSPWIFYDSNGDLMKSVDCSLAMGAIPMAAALWAEAVYPAQKIMQAEKSEHKNEELLQKAKNLYIEGKYKQAAVEAEKAMKVQDIPIAAILALTTTFAVIVAAVLIQKRRNKGKSTDIT